MRIVCCDDKKEITEYLCVSLREICKNADISAEIVSFKSGRALISYANSNVIDMVFLDISIGHESGIDIAKMLNSINPKTHIIYITAHVELVNKIWASNFENILIKPINRDRLNYVFWQAMGNVSLQKVPSLVFTNQNKQIIISPEEIVYIHSEGRKVNIYLKNAKCENVYGKISDLIMQLPDNFLMCHRSYIVNMDLIVEINSDNLVLKNKAIIPVPIKKHAEILKEYTEHNQRKALV